MGPLVPILGPFLNHDDNLFLRIFTVSLILGAFYWKLYLCVKPFYTHYILLAPHNKAVLLEAMHTEISYHPIRPTYSF